MQLFKEVGRGYNVTGEVNTNGLNIKMCYGGREIFTMDCLIIDINDYEEVSDEFDHYAAIGRRIIILMDRLDMARHNMRCYTGKEEYKKEYEREESDAQLFEDWIREIVTEYDNSNAVDEFLGY